MYGDSIAVILREIRRWRAGGPYARSWETIGRLGGRDGQVVTQGVEPAEQGPWSRGSGRGRGVVRGIEPAHCGAAVRQGSPFLRGTHARS
jgi:hypothetical protein